MKTLFLSLLAVVAGFGVSRLTATGSSGDGMPVSESRVPAHPPAGAGPPLTSSPSPKPDAGAEAPTWKAAAKAWAEADPAGFHRWLLKRGMPPEAEDGWIIRDLFKAWAGKDPEAALRAAFNLPQDFHSWSDALNAVLNTVIDQPGGLEKVLDWAPAVEDHLRGSGWAESAWLKSAPPEEIGAMLAKRASGQTYSGGLIQGFAGYWARQDLTAALAWMRSLPPALKVRGCEGLLSEWAKTDPAAALHYLATQATTAERRRNTEALAALANTDPRAAVEWSDKNLGLADYSSLGGIFATWCSKDSAEAKDCALAIEDPELRARAVASWGSNVEVKEVQTVAAGLPEGRDRRVLLDSVSSTPEAMPFLRKEMEKGSPSISSETALYVGRMSAYEGAEAAFAWATALPEHLRTTAITGVLDNWNNKTAAAQAVEQLPDGPLKIAARKALGKKNLTNWDER